MLVLSRKFEATLREGRHLWLIGHTLLPKHLQPIIGLLHNCTSSRVYDQDEPDISLKRCFWLRDNFETGYAHRMRETHPLTWISQSFSIIVLFRKMQDLELDQKGKFMTSQNDASIVVPLGSDLCQLFSAKVCDPIRPHLDMAPPDVSCRNVAREYYEQAAEHY